MSTLAFNFVVFRNFYVADSSKLSKYLSVIFWVLLFQLRVSREDVLMVIVA